MSEKIGAGRFFHRIFKRSEEQVIARAVLNGRGGLFFTINDLELHLLGRLFLRDVELAGVKMLRTLNAQLKRSVLFLKPLPYREIHRVIYIPVVGKAYLRLGGVNVHIGRFGRNGELHHAAGELPDHYDALVRFLERL